MIVWINGELLGMGSVMQRARVLALDSERQTLIVRSEGQPNLIAEIPADSVKGVELGDTLTFMFSKPTVTFR